MSKPVATFTAMKREGGLGEPLLYAVIGGTFGGIFAVTYNFALRSFGSFGDRHDVMEHLFGGIGWIFLSVLTPLFVAIGMFVLSAILHELLFNWETLAPFARWLPTPWQQPCASSARRNEGAKKDILAADCGIFWKWRDEGRNNRAQWRAVFATSTQT